MKKPITVMRNELISMVQCLEPDAVEVLRAIAGRLQLGQRQYGQLRIDGDQRDWHKEASDEFLDGAVYLAIETIKRARSR